MTSQRRPSGKTVQYQHEVFEVVTSLKEYWPLTLRQIYYQLVASGAIDNNRNEYQKLSRNLTACRLEGSVPWESVEDRARNLISWSAWPTARKFIDDQMGDLLTGYSCDLLHSQPEALEVWVEKDALSRVCCRAASVYCVPVVVARGFASTSYKHDCRLRVQRNVQAGKKTHILYFGDLDPSGWAMLPAMMDTLKNDMGLGDHVSSTRCALTLEQVSQYNLPLNPDALKDSDSRAKKYREQFGDLAVELDALKPDVLEKLVTRSIKQHLDLDLVAADLAREKQDRRDIAALRGQVIAAAEGSW